MHFRGELKSIRGQSVGEVSAYQSCDGEIFRVCGNESQPGLLLVRIRKAGYAPASCRRLPKT